LTPRYGLALDNLLSAEVVLADGRLVNCDNYNNPDLFWAIRGGGGNFGVITTMRVRRHRIRQVLAGMMLFPWSQAESALGGHAESIAEAPDELSILAGVLPGPDGSPLVFLAPMWSGEGKQGEELIARLRQLGTPVIDRVGTNTYLDWLGMFGAAAPVAEKQQYGHAAPTTIIRVPLRYSVASVAVVNLFEHVLYAIANLGAAFRCVRP